MDLWFDHFKSWFSTDIVLDDGLDFYEWWSEWGNEEESEDDSDFHFLQFGNMNYNQIKIWLGFESSK